MAVSAPDENRNAPSTEIHARILRWTYRRSDEAVIYELGLDRQESAYELKMNSSEANDSVEIFRDAIAALMRQATIERRLVNDGWSLERFECHQQIA